MYLCMDFWWFWLLWFWLFWFRLFVFFSKNISKRSRPWFSIFSVLFCVLFCLFSLLWYKILWIIWNRERLMKMNIVMLILLLKLTLIFTENRFFLLILSLWLFWLCCYPVFLFLFLLKEKEIISWKDYIFKENMDLST